MHHARGDGATQHTHTHIKSIEHARVLGARDVELCGPVVLSAVIDEDVAMLSLEHLVRIRVRVRVRVRVKVRQGSGLELGLAHPAHARMGPVSTPNGPSTKVDAH